MAIGPRIGLPTRSTTISTPLQPMSINGAPTGARSGPKAGAAKTAGDDLWGRIKDINQAYARDDGSVPTKAAVDQTKGFYNPNNPAQAAQYQALSNLQDKMNPGLSWWHLRHPLGALAFEGAAQGAEAMDPNRQNPWLHTGLHAAALMTLFSGAPAAINTARQLEASRSALNCAARYAIGTGQPISTTCFRPPWRLRWSICFFSAGPQATSRRINGRRRDK